MLNFPFPLAPRNNVKEMVKSDVEIAIHGKQWPLSTYGPFRDKPSIPNFIEDKSFEEVRMLCYEAKQKNCFEQFHQQFTKEVMEANNKMNALLQMTPDVVDVLMKMSYVPSDTSSFNAAAGKTTNNSSNPFGLGNNNSNANSIFNKTSTNNTSGNNLFANKSTFGPTNEGTSGLFSNTSVFAPQQQTSVFAQAPQSTNPIFAQQQNPSNLFAASAQQQATNTNALFSQQNQFLQPSQQSSNIFRQALQTSQPQQGLFAQAAQTIQQQQQQQVQPQQGLFAQAAQQALPAGQNLFAQAAQQTQNIFNQALQQQQQQQTNANIFQQNQPNSVAQQQQTTSNIFQQIQPIANSQQMPNMQSSGVAFQQNALQTQNPTGQTNSLPPHISTLYSRLEDLTADEIEAFKADCFLPGKIPFNPPPRELIN